MDWSLATQLGIQVGSTLLQGAAQSSAVQAQEDAKNDAIKAYNKQLILKSAQDVSALNVSIANSRMQTTQALFATQTQALKEKSSRNANAAASDTMGTSVNQALMAVDTAASTASSMYMLNQQLTEDQINAKITHSIATAKMNLQNLQTNSTAATNAGTFGKILEQVASSDLVSNYIKGW